jgi:hypothetical protein
MMFLRRFLIDECLSTGLVGAANAAGFEASHVAWMGMSGAKDWTVARFAEANGWILVTRNSEDFRGSAACPGDKGHYAGLQVHDGLVCLNGPDGLNGRLQAELFLVALDRIADLGDITNQVIDVTLQNADDDFGTVAVHCVPRDEMTIDWAYATATVRLSPREEPDPAAPAAPFD